MKLQPDDKQKNVLVLLATSFFSDPRVTQEVKILLKNGFNVNVLCWDRNGTDKDQNEKNLRVKNLKLLHASNFSRISYFLSALLFQIYALVIGTKILKGLKKKLIIHANDFNTLFGAYLLGKLFKKKIEIIYDCHELTPAVYKEWFGSFFGKITGFLEQKMIKRVSKIITVSPPIQRYLESISKKDVSIIYNYPSEKLIPKGTKKELRQELNLSPKKIILSYIGTLRIDVALEELVESIQILKEKNLLLKDIFEIHIIGDGPLKDKLTQLVNSYNLEKLIKIHGKIKREKAIKYLKSSDLSYVVFKNLGDNTRIGMPWKLFESIACGTKTITVANTYTCKFIEKEGLGFTLESIDPNVIAKNLVNIISKYADKEDLNKEKENGKYLWEKQENVIIKTFSI